MAKRTVIVDEERKLITIDFDSFKILIDAVIDAARRGESDEDIRDIVETLLGILPEYDEIMEEIRETDKILELYRKGVLKPIVID